MPVGVPAEELAGYHRDRINKIEKIFDNKINKTILELVKR